MHEHLQLELQDSGPDAGLTLALAGELDLATAPRLEVAVKRICQDGVAELTLDLRSLRFIDSAGLRAMLEAATLCNEHRCRLLLTNCNTEIERLFELTGTSESLPFAMPSEHL
jgi:anti-sigma B factor antagonist